MYAAILFTHFNSEQNKKKNKKCISCLNCMKNKGNNITN